MADVTQARRGPSLLAHAGDIQELDHIATALRLIGEHHAPLDPGEVAAVYFLACLAGERTERLLAAVKGGDAP